ncbi:vesicle-associated membrane protein 1 [Limosa lapponica baueri]|uniref:Vesicle-associated membrane protein 1 n=20 Tax=Neoaves TaxID=3078114 RepID=A0A2I0TTI5_LIMLA|nr:vesicle-associated membrane protein 1 [Limosa lapponica baueri]
MKRTSFRSKPQQGKAKVSILAAEVCVSQEQGGKPVGLTKKRCGFRKCAEIEVKTEQASGREQLGVIMSDPAQQPAPGAPEGGAPGGGPPGPPPNLSSNRRLQQTQAQVEEVVDIMRVNVDKVLERDQKLSELDDRADALQAGASQFESSAAKLKRKYWWKNCKMMIMMGVICAIVVVVIVSKYQKAQDERTLKHSIEHG